MLGKLRYVFVLGGSAFLLLSPILPDLAISVIAFFTFGAISLGAATNFFHGWDEFVHYMLPISLITGSLAGILGIFFSHVLFVISMMLLSAITYFFFIERIFDAYQPVGLVGMVPVGIATGFACHRYKRHILSVLTCAVGSLMIDFGLHLKKMEPTDHIGWISIILFILGLVYQYFVISPAKKKPHLTPPDSIKEGEPESLSFRDLNKTNFYV
jgi:hypothetical protein